MPQLVSSHKLSRGQSTIYAQNNNVEQIISFYQNIFKRQGKYHQKPTFYV